MSRIGNRKLRRLLNEGTLMDQVHAIRQCAKTGQPEMLQPLLQKLDTASEPLIIREIVLALSAYKHIQAAQAIVREAGHPSFLVREAVCLALEPFDIPERLPILRRALSDVQPAVQYAACRVIGRVGSVQDVPYVLPLLDSPYWELRECACRAIARLGGPVERLIEVLEWHSNASSDTDLIVRNGALLALSEVLPPEQAMPLLLAVILSEPWEVESIRLAARIRELGVPIPDEAMTALISLLNDTISSPTPIRILGALGDHRAAPRLLELIADSRMDDHAIRALIAMRYPGLREFVQLMILGTTDLWTQSRLLWKLKMIPEDGESEPPDSEPDPDDADDPYPVQCTDPYRLRHQGGLSLVVPIPAHLR